MPIRPQAAPPASAVSTEDCSSRLIERAARFIQNTMQTSTKTAMKPIAASNISCAFCGKPALSSCSTAPAKSAVATARKIPIQTAGSHCPRPVWRR